MSRVAANLILMLTALIWGATFVAQSTAMAKIGPVSFTGLRFAISAAALVPFVLHERGGTARAGGGGAGLILAVAAMFLCGQFTQQIGIVATSVTNAGFLTALYVVFVPLLGIALFRQWPHVVVWPSALAALAGTWLLGGGGGAGLGRGDAAIIVSAVFWAIHVVLIGRAVRVTGRPFLIVFLQSLLGGMVALPLGLAVEAPEAAAIVSALPELLFAGLLSGALGYSLQAIGQRHAGAGEAAVILSSEALFAALAGAILLGERIGVLGLAGCALILAAVVAVQLVPLRAAGGAPPTEQPNSLSPGALGTLSSIDRCPARGTSGDVS